MGKTREANNPLIIAPSAGAGGGGGSSGALARWLKRYLILNYSLNHGSEVCFSDRYDFIVAPHNITVHVRSFQQQCGLQSPDVATYHI